MAYVLRTSLDVVRLASADAQDVREFRQIVAEEFGE